MRFFLTIWAGSLAFAACTSQPMSRRGGRAAPPEEPEAATTPSPGAAPQLRDAIAPGPAADAAPVRADDAAPPPLDTRALADARVAADGQGDGAPLLGGDPAPCPFRLCESFEGYADGAQPGGGVWSAARGVRVDSTRAARGRKALRITTGVDPGEWYMRETRTFAAPTARFYVRAFLWIDRQPRRYVHWTLFEASERPDGWGWVARHGAQQFDGAPGASWIFNIETHGQGETALLDSNTVPAKTWNCVEAVYDPSRNEADLWWNGQERPRVHWRNNQPGDARFTFRPLRSLSIGWGFYLPVDGGFDVWIDEIVVSDERVGCDR
jgi:hypothetical protein